MFIIARAAALYHHDGQVHTLQSLANICRHRSLSQLHYAADILISLLRHGQALYRRRHSHHIRLFDNTLHGAYIVIVYFSMSHFDRAATTTSAPHYVTSNAYNTIYYVIICHLHHNLMASLYFTTLFYNIISFILALYIRYDGAVMFRGSIYGPITEHVVALSHRYIICHYMHLPFFKIFKVPTFREIRASTLSHHECHDSDAIPLVVQLRCAYAHTRRRCMQVLA